MERLTEIQKQQIVRRMKSYEDDTMDTHAKWASLVFDVPVTAEECSKLYIDYLCG